MKTPVATTSFSAAANSVVPFAPPTPPATSTSPLRSSVAVKFMRASVIEGPANTAPVSALTMSVVPATDGPVEPPITIT